jgi:thymidylate synthase (FAD)
VDVIINGLNGAQLDLPYKKDIVLNVEKCKQEIKMKIELLNYFGNDLMVINAARVSYGKTKEIFDEKDEKLIKFLVEHKHTAPFRHPQLQFRIECPIFVERQLFKHQVGLCLAGDTKITFITKSKGHKKENIESLYNRWTKGRIHQESAKDAIYTQKRIKEKRLRILNEETGIFEIGYIKNVFFSGEKQLYLITLENGKQIKCSENHLIYTKSGWLNINKGLSTKDLVGCNGVKFVGTGLYRDKNYMDSLRKKGLNVTQMAEICQCGYDNIRKWLRIHNLQFKKEEICFKKGFIPWNKGITGYTLNISEEGLKNKQKNISRGKNSHFWRRGITNQRALIGQWTRNIAKQVYKKYNYTCQKCGMSSSNLCSHHIIPVVQDISKAYDFNNLICLCQQCHRNIHKNLDNETNFAKKVLSDDFKPFEYYKRIGNRPKFKTRVDFSKIISIEKIGVEKTYDIEVDNKFHNFIANGMVVHNSANSISGRYVDFSDKYYLFDKLRKQSKSSKQGSEGILDRPDLIEKIKNIVQESAMLYKELCEAEVAKEQARAILPLCLETQFIWTGSLLAYIHFWNLRLKKDAQEETRNVAIEMLNLVKNIKENPFKYTIESFNL